MFVGIDNDFDKIKILFIVYGLICDLFDCVMRNIFLLELFNGDWFMFLDVGVYIMVGVCDFNGILCLKYFCFYVSSEKMMSMVMEKEFLDLVYVNDRSACTFV